YCVFDSLHLVVLIFIIANVGVIREKLCGMEHSLSMLSNVPDYKERKQHLEELKNKLEALLSTQMVQAFRTLQVEEAKRYVTFFSVWNFLLHCLLFFLLK